MALCDPAIVDFGKNLNRQTVIPVVVDQIILSPTYPTDVPGINKLRLTLKDDYVYRGTGVLKYARLNLSDIELMLTVPPNINPVSTRLYSILDEVTQGMGILLTEDDVYDSGVVNDPVRGLNIELKAKPESYRWYGVYRLYFNNLPPLSSTLTRLEFNW